MAWFELHQELWSHPKTKRMARLLDIPRPQAVGHVVGLWIWALDYAQDGDLSTYEPGDIADACDWQGDADQLVAALLECGRKDGPGFLFRGDDGLEINDWEQYAGKTVKKRKQTAVRVQRKRERDANATDDTAGSNADVTRYKGVSNDATVQYSTEQNITEQDTLLTESTTTHLENGAHANGHSSGTVDTSLFLSVIGFKDAEAFQRSVDATLLAQWAFYYSCLNDKERTAVRSWPALVNDRVRNGKPPRMNGEQKARFYREWH